jgi:hypothetical protein
MENCPDGNLARFENADIADGCEWEGDADLFVGALIDCGVGGFPGFLLPEDGRLLINGWDRDRPLMVIPSEGRLPWKEWNALRLIVFARDNYTCTYCGTNIGPFHCDHILPVRRGGNNDLANLATACARCNLSKNDTPLNVWRKP